MAKPKDAQLNSISLEAGKTLKAFRFFDIPNFIPITDKMIFRIRDQFQKGEDKVEMGLIDDYHLSVKDIELNGVKGKLMQSPNTQHNQGVVFNIHGGGFIMGTARDRNGLLAAAETDLPVYSVEYTLSPEADSKTSLKEVFDFYQGLIQEVGNQAIYGFGSSAGVTLLTATVMSAHQRNLRLPNALVLFAPALDISGNGDSAVFNNRRDVSTAHLALRLAQGYIGDADPTSPAISPLYGEVGPWFPATFMSTGTRDIMLSNVLRFSDKLQEAGVPNQYIVKEGMWHGFTWEDKLPEAVITRKQAWQFMKRFKENE